jgi:hypothetical protein
MDELGAKPGLAPADAPIAGPWLLPGNCWKLRGFAPSSILPETETQFAAAAAAAPGPA